MKTLEDEW